MHLPVSSFNDYSHVEAHSKRRVLRSSIPATWRKREPLGKGNYWKVRPHRVKCKNQHGMLAFFRYFVSERHTKNVKKTLRSADIFYSFFVDLGVIFNPGGTPGASRATLNTKVRSHVVFWWVWDVPGEALGVLFGLFNIPWAALELLGNQKWSQKCEKKCSRCAVRSRSEFWSKKGRGPDLHNVMKT
jgi:hypothetical protein